MAAFLFHGSTLDHLLSTFGYAAVFGFIAVESLGIPFPGETMLITASLYTAATHHLAIELVIVAAAAGAIVGDNIGFAIGRWGGYRLLLRYGKYVRLHEGRLKLGRYVFMRHGAKVVFFGRFVSILRTYAAFLAGTNHMDWRRFLFFNASGGIVWALLYGLGFYFAGNAIKSLSTPFHVAIGIAAALVTVAFLFFLRRNEKRLEAEAERALPGPVGRARDGATGDERGPQPAASARGEARRNGSADTAEAAAERPRGERLD